MAHRNNKKNDMSNSKDKSDKVIVDILNSIETPLERN